MCHDDALYKFTFYLLTYLLTYLQAPVTMKTILQAGWLLTNACGNLIVIIVTFSTESVMNQVLDYSIKFTHYLRQGGYVFAFVCLSVCRQLRTP